MTDAGGVTPEWLETGGFEVEIACERVPAELQLQASHDPRGERVRG